MSEDKPEHPTLKELNQIRWTTNELNTNPLVEWETGLPMIGHRQVIPLHQRSSILQQEWEEALAGRDKLYSTLREKYVGLSRRFINGWLKGNEAVQITRSNTTRQAGSSKNITIKPIIPSAPFSLWFIDLLDISAHANVNRNYKWVFLLVDGFSKYLWAFALKNKRPLTTTQAFDTLLEELEEERGARGSRVQPRGILSDQGSEWKGLFEERMKELGIQHIHTLSRTPQSNPAESYVRLIKVRFQRHYTYTRTKVWLDVLPGVVNSYNTQIHSVTGQRPVDILNNPLDNWTHVHDNIVAQALKRKSGQDLRDPLVSGDRVRVTVFADARIRETAVFRKGVNENWSRTVYTVSKVRKSRKTTSATQYEVQYRGKTRFFTRDQLQKIPDSFSLRIMPKAKVRTVPSDVLLPPTALSERIPGKRRASLIGKPRPIEVRVRPPGV